jgi:hypothetical protein
MPFSRTSGGKNALCIRHAQLNLKNFKKNTEKKRKSEENSEIWGFIFLKAVSICPVCKKEFETVTNKIYCSPECYYKSKYGHARNSKVEKTCPICGKKFMARNYVSCLGSQHLYCSEECQHEASRRRRRAFNEKGV